ncbi:hypothetical protein SAMN03159312_4138 [Pseudomonas sp. NFIX49]|nr:hypothetical protein SAMN03159313_4146 [Pseudomonas sp. NFIX46]SDB39150.1 hypothetical protein SAMN03097715_02831 [Pseudomonas putida]SFQ90483.1 hypothetical protein SAMN03159312_4138 [Pseudomonas sp. NFIX49]
MTDGLLSDPGIKFPLLADSCHVYFTFNPHTNLKPLGMAYRHTAQEVAQYVVIFQGVNPL